MHTDTNSIVKEGVLSSGRWQLYADGTLSIQGIGSLTAANFQTFNEKITRIEVQGYHTIGKQVFAFLPFLQAVILDPMVTQIQEKAFYGCCQLQDISLAREFTAAYDAFDGTPLHNQIYTEAQRKEYEEYFGEFEIELQPEPLENTQFIWDFWNEADRCLSGFEHSIASEEDLTPAIRLLRQAAAEGDPASMYLWAEFLLWGSFTADKMYTDTFLGILPEDESVRRAAKQFVYHNTQNRILLNDPDQNGCIWNAPDAREWYVRSAKAGYVPAISWLSWCAKRGIVTPPSEPDTNYWISFAGKFPPAKSLITERLNAFVEAAIDLGHSAYNADLEEDIAADQGYDPPWPTWRDLFSASMVAYKLGCMLGSPRCALPIHEFQAYDYERCDSLERRRMCIEKRLWQIWSGLNGIGVEKASPEILQSWLTDVERAVDYGKYTKHHMLLDEKTEALIQTLREAVQQHH